MDLNNSMTEDSSPIAAEHIRLLQVVESAKLVLKNTLKLYSINKAKDSNQLLWLIFPALDSTLQILEDAPAGE